MTITAKVSNRNSSHEVMVTTNNSSKIIPIGSKVEGKGSSINGGELLFTALATCFCNDIYREAVRRDIQIEQIIVTVTGEFGGEGEPAKSIFYETKIDSPAPKEEIRKLIEDVDRIAEIHNTLRQGIAVTLRN